MHRKCMSAFDLAPFNTRWTMRSIDRTDLRNLAGVSLKLIKALFVSLVLKRVC